MTFERNIPTLEVMRSSQYFELFHEAAASESCFRDAGGINFLLVKLWGFSHQTARFCCPQFNVHKRRPWPCIVLCSWRRHPFATSKCPSLFCTEEYQDLERPTSIPVLSISPATAIFILPLRSVTQTNPLLLLFWCATYPTPQLTPMEPPRIQRLQLASSRDLNLLSFTLL